MLQNTSINVPKVWAKVEDLIKDQIDPNFTMSDTETYSIQNTTTGTIEIGEFETIPTENSKAAFLLSYLQFAEYKQNVGELYIRSKNTNYVVISSKEV